MTKGELKKLLEPGDDEMIVTHNTGTKRVPVYAVQVYRDQEMTPDEKFFVWVEKLDIS